MKGPESMQISKSVVSDTIGQDTIVINIFTGAYYSLTKTGTAMWQLFQSHLWEQCEPSNLRCFISEGLIESENYPSGELADPADLFTKYVDMEALLIADPVHEVDEQGWPKIR